MVWVCNLALICSVGITTTPALVLGLLVVLLVVQVQGQGLSLGLAQSSGAPARVLPSAR